jgi:hypothetical protein
MSEKFVEAIVLQVILTDIVAFVESGLLDGVCR